MAMDCEELEERLDNLEALLRACKPICINETDGHLEELDIDATPQWSQGWIILSGNEALGVKLDNVQKLLEKLDTTATKQWEDLNKQGNALIQIRGEISLIEEKHNIHQEYTEKELTGMEADVKKNTTLRQNMIGFSWVRHGLPFAAIIMGIVTLITRIWPK